MNLSGFRLQEKHCSSFILRKVVIYTLYLATFSVKDLQHHAIFPPIFFASSEKVCIFAAERKEWIISC